MSRELVLSSGLLAVICLVVGSCAPKGRGAQGAGRVTLTVTNARIWTGDASQPWAEALAVNEDRIVAVGSIPEIEAIAEGGRVIDAQGRLVVPGFIDTHLHFISGGFALAAVQLRDAATPEEFAGRIRSYAATVPAGTWITGGDWDHEQWGGELPRRDWIDAATPHHPVFVSRLDGHMALANTAAMEAAGVTEAVRDVAGGTIVRDSDGVPTGVFKDNAMDLIQCCLPDPTPEASDSALAAAMRYVNEQGVTSVHHMGSWDDLETFARAWKAGRLTTRIYAAVPLDSWQRLHDAVASREYGGPDGHGDVWLKIGGLKGYVDGSLGSHTAAFLEPYSDAPEDSGLYVNTPEELYQWISGADKAGFQAIVHAIGDGANRMLLDTYQRITRENGERDRRFRIEHAQHLAAADVTRFAELGVIPVMQPYHAIDDGRWAEKVIGAERAKEAYAFRSLLDANARLVFGSDWTVAPATPLEGIYAAVTRRTLDGKHPDGWVPEQKISVEQAVRAYTVSAAYASFDEHEKGTLAAGRLADLVILERDLFAIPPEEIGDVKVKTTVVGGKVVYERGTN
jgi:predicted amidohydrolase YtcJ